MNAIPTMDVAVAVIERSNGDIFISKRLPKSYMGGIWEFPGGKRESNETIEQALIRECHEELAIEITKTQPLIKIEHDYGDRYVTLYVYRVISFVGEPKGNEGQVTQWVPRHTLLDYTFPPANDLILKALFLPDCYAITPEPEMAQDVFLAKVEQMLKNGQKLIQFRAKKLPLEKYLAITDDLAKACRAYGARLVLNGPEGVSLADKADGVHLTSGDLMKHDARPVAKDKLLGASCHSADELSHAQSIEVDYVCLSPVKPTASHMDNTALGWQNFKALATTCPVPVYALGGLNQHDSKDAFNAGARGICGISSFWPS